MKIFKRNLSFITLLFLFVFIAGCHHNHSDYVGGNSQYVGNSKVDTTISGAVKTESSNNENKTEEVHTGGSDPAMHQVDRRNDTEEGTAKSDSTASANHSDSDQKKDSSVKK